MNEKIERLEASLKSLGKKNTHEKVDVLTKLAREMAGKDVERASELNQTALKLAEKLSYTPGLAQSKYNLGFFYYLFESNFDSSLRYSYEALNLFEQLKDEKGQADTLGTIGLVYWSMGNFDLALDYLHKSEQLSLKIKNNQLPWTYNTLGAVYRDLGDFQKSLEYHKQSLKIFKKRDEKLGEARALSGIGTVYQSQKNIEKALQFHTKSLALFQNLEAGLGEARALNDIGVIHQNQGNFEKALANHHRSLEIRKRVGNKNAQVTSLLNLGKLYVQMKEVPQALDMLKLALKIAEQISAKPKLYQVHQTLSETYEMDGKLEKALQHLKLYQATQEQVFSDESSTRLKNLQIQFEVEKSEKEAEIHRLKNIELKQALDNLRDAQVQLVQSEKMAALGQLTAGIAHEINNPIGAIISSADISIRSVKKVRSVLSAGKSLDEILQNRLLKKSLEVLEISSETTTYAAHRIATIVDSLKNFARLDEAEFKRADVHEGIESTLTLLAHKINNGIEVVKNFGNLPEIDHYPNQLNQVFMTILRNAIQAIKSKGKITITTTANDKSVQIKISDTGRGMAPEILDSLFDLSFTTKSSRIGVGMGLYSANNIMKKHHGSIKVKSEIGKGTEFLLILAMR